MPPAYVIAQVDVRDAEKYPEYAKQVPATIASYDGTYLARGGRIETLEGAEPLPRMVVLAFPSWERAKQWYDSAEYATPKAIRQAASIGHLWLVEGLD